MSPILDTGITLSQTFRDFTSYDQRSSSNLFCKRVKHKTTNTYWWYDISVHRVNKAAWESCFLKSVMTFDNFFLLLHRERRNVAENWLHQINGNWNWEISWTLYSLHSCQPIVKYKWPASSWCPSVVYSMSQSYLHMFPAYLDGIFVQ